MKFANMTYVGTQISEHTQLINMGDYLQCLSIEYIYKKMGVEKGEIIHLSPKEIRNYGERESIILPLNWAIFDPNFMNEKKELCLSPTIIPVFLAMTLGVNYDESYFNKHNIDYLKRYAPIGCRDEITAIKLKEYGIDSYLNGCLTSVLPSRDGSIRSDVLLIDVPIELYDHIPEELTHNAKVYHQQYYDDLSRDNDEIKKEIKNKYKMYSETSGLIITSRLHVASPALAMGIPVVFYKSIVDMRLSWLDKHISLYTFSDINQIDWKPKPVKYEDLKDKVIDNCINRIKNLSVNTNAIRDIDGFYKNRANHQYTSFVDSVNDYRKGLDYLKRKYPPDATFEYAIWGTNDNAQKLIRKIKHAFPKSIFSKAIDLYKEGYFDGLRINKPHQISFETIENLIVVPVAASNMAHKMLKRLRVDTDKYCLCSEVYID